MRFSRIKRNGAGARPQDQSEHRADSPYFILTAGGKPVELVAQARADGRDNLPESEARDPNEVETAVWREHERQHLELIEQTRNALRELKAQFEALEDRFPRPEDVAASIDESVAGLEYDLGADQTFVPLRQEQQLRRRDLRALIRERGLAREASYPPSRLLHLGIVALLVVAESVANAEFFASASPRGLVGGFLQAVGVSLVNVISGLLTGFFCLRGLNHSNRQTRVLAGAGVVAYALFALGFNLAVAHLRDLSATGEANIHASLSNLLSSPVDLSLPSAALFAIGLIASILGLWKGFRLDDPVPGFGERHRRFVASDRDLAQSTAELRRRALGRVEVVPDRCRAIVRRADDILRQIHATTVSAQRAVEFYEAQRAHLEDRCEVLLRRYRDENRAVRTTPEPLYFASFPTFPTEIDRAPVEQLIRRLERANNVLDELKAEEDRVRRGQPERFKDAAGRFERFLAERLRQADAGRADGSSHGLNDGPAVEERAS